MKFPKRSAVAIPGSNFQAHLRASPTDICVATQRTLCPVLGRHLGIKVSEEIGQYRTVALREKAGHF